MVLHGLVKFCNFYLGGRRDCPKFQKEFGDGPIAKQKKGAWRMHLN
jgi:hypothetical protein